MHPFNVKTLYAIAIALVCYFICYYTFSSFHGFSGILLKSTVFAALYGGAIIYFDLSPDVLPVLKTIKKRGTIPWRGRK